MNPRLLYIGSLALVAWGIAHVAPTRSIVQSFGSISAANRLTITMTWVNEGLGLIFIGLLALALALSPHAATGAARLVYRACALMLIVSAVWTALTGARTPVVPMKLCPFVKTGAAVLLVLGGGLPL
jgi:hypothetical protein